MNASTAQILSAIGTVGTLLIALLLLARDQRDRRADQARRVSAWAISVGPKREATEFGAAVGIPGNCVTVLARNGSEAPVYDLQVWVHADYSPTSGKTGSMERLLPPGEVDIPVDGVTLPAGGLAGEPYVDVTFADARGRRWQRRHTGSLGRDRLSGQRHRRRPGRG